MDPAAIPSATANSIRMQSTSSIGLCSGSGSNDVIITFPHYQPVLFVKHVELSYHCPSFAFNSTVYLCNSLLNETATARCNGSFVPYTIRVHCAVPIARPVCLPFEGLATTACQVLAHSASETTCICNMCDLAGTNNSRRLVHDRDLETPVRGLQSAHSTMAIGFIAAAQDTSAYFVEVVSTASQFDSAQAIRDTAIVGGTFAVMWFVGWFALYVRYSLEQDYNRAIRKLEQNDRLTNPSPADAPPVDPLLGAQMKLKEYVHAIFPVVYSDLSK